LGSTVDSTQVAAVRWFANLLRSERLGCRDAAPTSLQHGGSPFDISPARAIRQMHYRHPRFQHHLITPHVTSDIGPQPPGPFYKRETTTHGWGPDREWFARPSLRDWAQPVQERPILRPLEAVPRYVRAHKSSGRFVPVHDIDDDRFSGQWMQAG
jgi:hypothetical protein